MYSTLYILLSTIVFCMDELPMHLHLLHLKKYTHADTIYMYSKGAKVLESLGFWIACLNQAACIVLLGLKIMGVIKWW